MVGQSVTKRPPLAVFWEYLSHIGIKVMRYCVHLAPAIQQGWVARLDTLMLEDSRHTWALIDADVLVRMRT